MQNEQEAKLKVEAENNSRKQIKEKLKAAAQEVNEDELIIERVQKMAPDFEIDDDMRIIHRVDDSASTVNF